MKSTKKDEKEEEITLEEKVETYEKLLTQILKEAPKSIGTIVAGPYNDLYRVIGDDGKTIIVPLQPDLKAKDLPKFPARVLLAGPMIECLLPDILELKSLPPEFKRITWDQVGGLKSQVNKIREAIETPLDNAAVYAEFNQEPLKGALLYGPPGCGKTLIAKAIASKFLNTLKTPDERSFTYIKGGELLSMYVGATEQAIKRIFENARKHKKDTGVRAVIFLDEAEALLNRRGSRRSSDVDTTIVPTFLSEMDGFEGDNPFIILGTNRPEQLDEAILRDGRIDLKIEIKRPSQTDSVEIFEIHLNNTKVIGDVKKMATKASELLFTNVPADEISGAMIETIVKKSTLCAIKRSISDKSCKKGVILSDLETSLKNLNAVENEAVL